MKKSNLCGKRCAVVGLALTGAVLLYAYVPKASVLTVPEDMQQVEAPLSRNGQMQKGAFDAADARQSLPALMLHRSKEVGEEKTCIYSTMVYRAAWDAIEEIEQVPFGVYSFSPEEEITFEQQILSHDMAAVSSAAIVNGMYFVCLPLRGETGQVNGSLYAAFDLKNNSLLATAEGPLGTAAYQLATDPSTDTVYGIFYNDSGAGWCWGSIDLTTMQRTWLADCDFMLAFGCDVDGHCYGIDADSHLVSFDAQSHSVTDLGNTGVGADYLLQSGTIDPQSGIFYWASYSEAKGSVLYSIDKNTAHASRVGVCPDHEELVGLAIAAQSAPADAPARPSVVTLSFEDGNLTGSVQVTAPTQTYGREPLYGTLTAHFYVDAQEAGTQTVEAGALAETELTVPSDGFHTVAVSFENTVGMGPQNSVTYYFGIDAPGEVIEPTLVNNGGVAEITWDAPETSCHGGYFEPERFNYSVMRHRGGQAELVAEHLTDVEWSEPIETENIETLYYSIIAYSDNNEGATSLTNKATFGEAFTAPCEWQLDDPDEFALFTAIDANGDGYSWEPGTWRYTQNKTTYAQNMWNPDDVTSADDWFITPAVRLQPGRVYYFRFAYNNTMDTTVETYEVKMGQGKTVSAMTRTLAGPTNAPVNGATFNWYHHSSEVRVEEAGNYSFGIHCLSKAPSYYRLYVDSLFVDAGPLLTGADSVTSLCIEPAAKAGMQAKVSFDAPARSLEGAALQALSKVDVYRRPLNDESWTLVKTFEQPAPGQALSYVDEGMKNGFNVYRVVPSTTDGEGVPVEKQVYVGLDEPVSLPWVDYEFTDEGIRLFWPQADTLGRFGGYVDPAGVTYSVYEGNAFEYIERACTETELLVTEPALWEGRQTMKLWGVIAHNSIGRSLVTFAERYVHGAPHTLPLVENFTNGQISTNWFTGDNNMYGGTWRIGSDPTGNGAMSYNAQPGGFRAVVLGPVDLAGTDHPVLKFDHYNTMNSADSMEIYISTHGLKNSLHKVYCAVGSKTVTTHTVDLTPYKDSRRVSIAFGGWGVNASCVQYVDNIIVRDSYGHNLALGEVEAAGEVAYDGQLSVHVTVVNYGDYAAEGYSVSLYKDGKERIATVEGKKLEASESATYTLVYEPELTDDDYVSLHAEIAYDEDELPDDDASDIFQVRVRKPYIPVVEDLAGTLTDGTLTLTWSEPAYLHGMPVHEEEDGFEDYMDFEIESIGRWSTYDADGLKVYGISSLSYPHQYGPCAFQVFNPRALGIPSGMNLSAHSGDKFLIAFASQLGEVDDWLISPELSGEAQTIGFWAKGLNENLPESFEVWSGKVAPVPILMQPVTTCKTQSGWKYYTVDLPAETKYFAVRYRTASGNALMLDDIAFDVAAQPAVLHFKGYNAYRGETLLNAEPLTNTGYTQSDAREGSYTVTVVYDELESAHSNVVEVVPSEGIATVTSDSSTNRLYEVDGKPVDEAREGRFCVSAEGVTLKR